MRMPKIITLIPSILLDALSGLPVTSEASQERAWDLLEESSEAGSLQEAREILEEALELDPHNAHIMISLHGMLKMEPEAELELLHKMLAFAERELDSELFEDARGHFWHVSETRPYMLIRDHIAENLLVLGRLEEAAEEWQAMLALNPNDNQGIRYSLLCCLLALGKLAEVRGLFEAYDECSFNTTFAWGKVLERLIAGDEVGAKEAVNVARKQNPHTEKLLLGKAKMPKHLLDSYMGGDISEAQHFADRIFLAWSKHPSALGWLLVQGKKPAGTKKK